MEIRWSYMWRESSLTPWSHFSTMHESSHLTAILAFRAYSFESLIQSPRACCGWTKLKTVKNTEDASSTIASRPAASVYASIFFSRRIWTLSIWGVFDRGLWLSPSLRRLSDCTYHASRRPTSTQWVMTVHEAICVFILSEGLPKYKRQTDVVQCPPDLCCVLGYRSCRFPSFSCQRRNPPWLVWQNMRSGTNSVFPNLK